MSPQTIQTVAIAGATGNTGPTLITTLIHSGFSITVLTRSFTKAFSILAPIGDMKIIEVDYLSLDSLVAALTGIDAVVVCGVGGLQEQENLITASLTTSVKLFLPPLFGPDISYPLYSSLPISHDRVLISSYLSTHADKMRYNHIYSGPPFDWCLSKGILINIKKREMLMYDDGNKKFSCTTLQTAAEAEVSVLKMDGRQNGNRDFRVHDAVISQNELLAIAKQLVSEQCKDQMSESKGEKGEGKQWTITKSSTQEMNRRAREISSTDKDNRMGLGLLKQVAIFGSEYEMVFERLDNAELGLGVMDEEGVKEVLRRFL